MQSETLCVFDVVEAAWPFFSVSEIKKAKKKKKRECNVCHDQQESALLSEMVLQKDELWCLYSV